MRADDVYVILNGRIRKLTEQIAGIATPIIYKGSVDTVENLPANPGIGWMYNIAQKSIYGEAGMNVAWTGTIWDPLGPIVDMSLYMTKEDGAKKLDKNQGAENSGKVAGINKDGEIVPMFPMGIEYNEDEKRLEFGSDERLNLNTGIQLDGTLSKNGYAADAGETGKKITELKGDFDYLSNGKKREFHNDKWHIGQSVGINGTNVIFSTSKKACSSYYNELEVGSTVHIDVKEGYVTRCYFIDKTDGTLTNKDTTDTISPGNKTFVVRENFNIMLVFFSKEVASPMSENDLSNINIYTVADTENAKDINDLKYDINSVKGDINSVKGDIDSVINDYDYLYKMFESVGIIGDSFSAVRTYYIDYLGSTQTVGDVEENSWGKAMERNSNRTYKIFAKGGLEASQWLTDTDKGYPVASLTENLCQAYIIGLGINDSARHDTSYIGTVADIDTTNEDLNANSFIGNYAKIIQKMKKLQRGVKIFVLTMGDSTTDTNAPTYQAYNEAIREIAGFFENVYLIDLYALHHEEYAEENGFFKTNTLANHFTPPAYQVVAKYISNEMSKIMYENPNDFIYTSFIGTDKATKIWKDVV